MKYVALLEGTYRGAKRVNGKPISNYMQTCMKPYPLTGETSVEV